VGAPIAESRPEALCRGVLNLHAPQDRGERHIRKRSAGTLAGEHVPRLLGERLDCVEDRQGARRQWHAVLAASLHALAGNGPHPRGTIDLGPSRAACFARADGGQNQEFNHPATIAST
jgi:hypothetical protein